MEVEDLEKANIVLKPQHLIVDQESDMTLFFMDSWVLDYRNINAPENGLKMTIVLKRKIMGEIMTTYFPSFLLLMITFATTFFKPFFFEAALTVNLTNMLVMTTIFISVMEKLPHTSYPKLIDYWLIFCQLVPFAEVILLTAKEYIRSEQDDNLKEASTTQTIQKSIISVVGRTLEEANNDIFQIQQTVTAENAPNDKRQKWLNTLNVLGEEIHIV